MADHVDGFPDWASEVTISHLIHHTSGIPEVNSLMQGRGVWFEMDASRDELLQAMERRTR